MTSTAVLTLSCPQRPGIVNAVTSFVYQHGCDITEHQQFDDVHSGRFFSRTAFSSVTGDIDVERLTQEFAATASSFDMEFQFGGDRQPRILVMVSKMGHCLNDLLFRWRSGSLGGEIVAVVSNHEDLRPMAEAAGLPFVHVPVTAATKPEAEARLLDLVAQHDATSSSSPATCRCSPTTRAGHCGPGPSTSTTRSCRVQGRQALPPGVRPRVKLVGATAHYVTPDLDEGPIIEQEVIRIDHTHDPAALATVGRDAEALALSRAVKWHCQQRVLLNGHSTVVFR